MKKINFLDYVAKGATFFAQAQIKWFGVCVTFYDGLFLVTTISLLNTVIPIHKAFSSKSDAMNEFSRIISLLSK